MKKTTVGSIFIKDVPWKRTEKELPSPLLNEVAQERIQDWLLEDARAEFPKQKSPPKRA